jgi:hypothetical protein
MGRLTMARGHSAFSLPELLIVSGLFSVFLLASYTILTSGLQVWDRTSSSQDASFQLQRARVQIERDLSQSSSFETGIKVGAVGDKALPEGDTLWFLSAQIESTQKWAQSDDGKPFWQRNILYYTAIPLDHDELYTTACPGTPEICPHKVLVRKVIDSGPATGPESTRLAQEVLLPPKTILNYLTRPTTGLSFPVQSSVEKAEVVATNLYSATFRADPTGQAELELEVTLVSFDLKEAGKKFEFRAGQVETSPYARKATFSVFPPN